jgi:DNA-directed RNA polymerase specialized sigma24 family protein
MSFPRAVRKRAFERLYRRRVADVYRYALAVVRSSEAAESVTQATFVTAFRASERGERPRKPLNWLLGIARDFCARRCPAADPEHRARSEHELTLSPSETRRAVGTVAFDERLVRRMRDQCRSYAEIADLLELDDAEVESLIFRARRAQRQHTERSLTCRQAERAISLDLDGRLPRAERKVLRAHFDVCPRCVQFDRMYRGSRAALRSFATAPLPEKLRAAGIHFKVAAGPLGSDAWES